MEKINFENKPSTDSPINADNLNLLQDNVEDAINNINFNISESAVKTDYSFENNPIFVKKINFGNLPNATIKDVNHYITNFSKIIKIEGTAVTSSGYGYSIPNNNMLVFFTSKYVRISTSSNESDYVAELLIYYV